MKMNWLQIALASCVALWAFVTICFYDREGALDREPRDTPGYVLFFKYTPPLWRKITSWVLPIWLLLFLISLFL
jgi:hypothetical protein